MPLLSGTEVGNPILQRKEGKEERWEEEEEGGGRTDGWLDGWMDLYTVGWTETEMRPGEEGRGEGMERGLWKFTLPLRACAFGLRPSWAQSPAWGHISTRQFLPSLISLFPLLPSSLILSDLISSRSLSGVKSSAFSSLYPSCFLSRPFEAD